MKLSVNNSLYFLFLIIVVGIVIVLSVYQYIRFFDEANGGQKQNFITLVLLVCLLMCLVAVMVKQYVNRRVAKSLDRMCQAVKNFSGGDLDCRIEMVRTNEFYTLAGALNSMADSLKLTMTDRLELAQEIEAHKQTAEKLREANERYALIAKGAKDVIWDWDIKKQRVEFSPRWKALRGLVVDGKPDRVEQWGSHVHPEDSLRVMSAMQAHFDGKTDLFEEEYRIRCKHGMWKWVLGRGVAHHDAEGHVDRMAGSETDITQRKKMIAIVKESEDRYRTLFEYAPFCIHEIDLNGRLISMNPAGLEMVSSTEDEVLGLTYCEFTSDKDRSRIERLMAEAIQGKSSIFEYSTGGTSNKIFKSCFIPIRGDAGEVVKLMGITEDITEYKQMGSELRQSQKMEALGQLTGGIAHDFNNILGIMLGNLDVLDRQLVDNPKASLRVRAVTKSGQKAANIIRQLLAFSRRKANDSSVTNVNEAIHEMKELILHSLTPGIDFIHNFDSELWSADINVDEFIDALLNLLINARDAMPGGGHVILETENRIIDDYYSVQHAEARPGEYVQVTVSDSGNGMSAEVLKNIFDPFFTTKPQGKGTGLGLSMVFGFVKRCGGFVHVYSQPEIGSTFRMYFPRARNKTQEERRLISPQVPLPRGHETLLVVDDEPGLLNLAKDNLESWGYRVMTASNGQQALEQLAQEPDIALMFSDVIMPGMNGYQLAEQASANNPNLQVLLASGFTGKTLANNGLARFNANLLSKPYSSSELAERIRSLLEDVENHKPQIVSDVSSEAVIPSLLNKETLE